jgi:hypothetical protein
MKRFAVSNVGTYKQLQSYKEILSNYKLEVEVVKDYENETDTCEIFHVTISDLDDLLKLKEDLGEELILKDRFYDQHSNLYNEPTIHIYDSIIG